MHNTFMLQRHYQTYIKCSATPHTMWLSHRVFNDKMVAGFGGLVTT